jgi:hypothetical protein
LITAQPKASLLQAAGCAEVDPQAVSIMVAITRITIIADKRLFMFLPPQKVQILKTDCIQTLRWTKLSYVGISSSIIYSGYILSD